MGSTVEGAGSSYTWRRETDQHSHLGVWVGSVGCRQGACKVAGRVHAASYSAALALQRSQGRLCGRHGVDSHECRRGM